jgi:predicted metal-binding protein
MSTEAFESLRAFAVQNGAEDTRVIPTRIVIVAEWPRWKCMYGCENYGKSLMCPPNSPTPDETRRLLKDYEYAMVLKYPSDKDVQSALFELERKAFLSGLEKSLVMTSGRCRLCVECNVKGHCVHPERARPSMESCGIDVYSTVRKAGFEISVKTTKEQNYSRFGLLLLK